MTPTLENILNTDEYSIHIVDKEFHRAQKRLYLKLACDTMLSEACIESIKQKLTSLMPPNSYLDVNITCCCDNNFIINDFKSACAMFRRAMKSAFPESAPIIDMCNILLSDSQNSISVTVPEKYLLAMKAPVAYLRKQFNISMPINLDDCEPENDSSCTENNDFVHSMPAPIPKTKEKTEENTKVKLIYGKLIPENAKITPVEKIKSEMKNVTVRVTLVPMTDDDKKRAADDCIKRVVADKHCGIAIQMYFAKRNAPPAARKAAIEKTSKINSDFKQFEGMDLLMRGPVKTDMQGELYLSPFDICAVDSILRNDTAQKKRVELHLHTNMSEMDGLTKQSEAIATAARWGHSAMAITDHGVVHAFPDAMRSAKKNGIKLLYGVEGYLQDDCNLIPISDLNKHKFVSVSVIAAPALGEMNLKEIAAVRHDTGEKFHTYVNTGIPTLGKFKYRYDEQLIANAPATETALRAFCDFICGYTVVTYNPVEYVALCHKATSYTLDIDLRHIDMKSLIHYMFTSPDPHVTTEHIANAFNALDGKKTVEDLPPLFAADQAMQTQKLFEIICDQFAQSGNTLPLMHGSRGKKDRRSSHFHIILIAKNRIGLRNMYKMITYSHSENFHKSPLMPRSLFSVRRNGIILGSACERGELFRAMLANNPDDELRRIAQWYDYLEIQPIGNNEFMLRNGIAKSVEDLRNFNRRILAIGDSIGKKTVATGDVHFLNPQDSVYRSILMHALNFKDAEQQAPLYFKTTDEMLEEFAYLGEDRAQEVVVDNTNAIADMCEPLTAYLNDKGTYAPVFEGANEELKGMALKRVHEIYGEQLPEIVQKRLEFELNSIINNGYATLYLMAQRLVFKSNSDGYLVGSRGSVGSSFVAFLAGITEVNPLAAHYVCPNCHKSDFNKGPYWCGADMPDRYCPDCGTLYVKYGFDIPFETFLGFKGDKTPDIDLNFSGEYQSHAHEYTKFMFGDDHSFRAGIISTLKDKTAFGYVRSFCEATGHEASAAEMHRLTMGCAGVKRTTGQHPGGMVVVPPEYEAEDFMPLQYPANKKDGNGLITHFDFHAMDDKLVKLDILGHVDPTALRMMQDMTGLNPQDIPLDDPDTRALFSTDKPLNIDLSELDCDVGTIGVPEYGTTFVRNILKNTRPTTIEELVRLAGLSHGTDVWAGNAEVLVSSGKATLGEVIGTRDDIMLFLISKGSDPLLAFKTMESVRKGKGLTPEMEENMKNLPLPDWYIGSCKLIKYMFPRAHAAAYLTMAFRVAYYKMHYPHVFYAVYYTTRADDFDIVQCSGGAQAILQNRKRMEREIKAAGRKTTTDSGESVAKLKELLSITEVVYEMNLRGIEFLPIDINKSEAVKFTVEDGSIRPPFNAIAGLGEGIAYKIVEARTKKGGPFSSVDEFGRLTGAGSSVIAKLEELGCFGDMLTSEQVTLF